MDNFRKEKNWIWFALIWLALIIVMGVNQARPEPIHHTIKNTLEIDGWHAFHLGEGVVTGAVLNNVRFQEQLYYHGIIDEPLGVKEIMLINFTKAIVWELGEYYVEDKGNYESWCNHYGGERKAWKNNALDVALSMVGCFLTLTWSL